MHLFSSRGGPGTGITASLRALAWPLAGLALLLAFNAVASPGFFHLELRDGRVFGTLIDILNQSAKVMLLAIGMTLVVASGGVDLSVGSVMAISGTLAALGVNRGDSLGGVLCLALAAATLAGVFNGLLVTQLRLQPIIATLVLMVAGRGIAMLLADNQVITFQHAGLSWLGNGSFLGLPFTLTLVALVAAAAAWGTRRTAWGLFLEATGDNETASHLAGLRTAAVKLTAYGVSGACAGIAGIIAASNIKAADPARLGETLELDAIFAVVAGGTALTGGRFTLIGSLIGSLLLQTLTVTLYNQNISSAVAPMPKALVILIVCLLHSARFRQQLARLWPARAARPAAPATP